MFENVPGILTAKQGKVYQEIKESFDQIGYTVLSGTSQEDRSNVIDFADFGVPQRRKRVILFGFQKKLNYEYPNFERHKLSWNSPLTTRDVISDLPVLKPKQGHDLRLFEYDTTQGVDQLSPYELMMREDSIGYPILSSLIISS